MSKRKEEFKENIEVYHIISTTSILEKLLKGTKVSHYKVDTHYKLSDGTHRVYTSHSRYEYPNKLLNVINNRIAFEEVTICRGMKNPTRPVLNNELKKFKVKSEVIYV